MALPAPDSSPALLFPLSAGQAISPWRSTQPLNGCALAAASARDVREHDPHDGDRCVGVDAVHGECAGIGSLGRDVAAVVQVLAHLAEVRVHSWLSWFG